LQKLINLGCKLNQYEGYCLLEKFSDVDGLVIVNTCCVTQEAETKSRKKFHQALRKYPGAIMVATGCACRIHPEDYIQASHVIDNVARSAAIKNITPKPDKTRYFLKIQDGCDMECTYCIVSKVRSRIESKSIMDIKQEIMRARSLGYNEVVLVGANIGLYGRDLGNRLEDLFLAISSIHDSPRIRLSSIEPVFVTDHLIQALKNLPLCRHFHIPIQSADNSVLKRMNRNYDSAFLSQAINALHDEFPDAALGADIIVGFPDEGDKEFMSTYRFLQEHFFTHLHVFPYSPRPGTAAYPLGDPIAKIEKKKRFWKLKKLITQKNYEYRKKLVNRKVGAIIEHKNGKCVGLTDNYIRVSIEEPCPANELVEVTIEEVTEGDTKAALCSHKTDRN
jgi:threonylcarbamoyladenosine tRNA methylthiotransferase MtaB